MHKVMYFLQKLGILVLSIIVLSIMVFAISRLTPTDPLQSYYGERTEKMSVEEKDAAREKLGLNEPIPVQYIRWAQEAIRGDFGISYKYKQNVMTVIASRCGNTLLLGGFGFVLIFFFAILLGIFCAMHEDRWIDRFLVKAGTISSCFPEFWVALILILIFSVKLRVLPSSGSFTVGKEADAVDRMRHLILPLCVVVFNHLWYYAYMIRNLLLEETRKDYVLLSRAEGMEAKKIVSTHCLRNAMPAIVSIMAISVSHILGGTYVVETVFSYPGLGTLSYESARYADYNMLMILCLITGAVVIFFNMLAQIINERIDPRIRAREILDENENQNERAGEKC